MRTINRAILALVLTAAILVPGSSLSAQAPKGPNPIIVTKIEKAREVTADTDVLPGTVLKAGTKMQPKQLLPEEDFENVPVPLPSRQLAVCYVLTEDVTTTVKVTILAGTRPALGSALRTEKNAAPLGIIAPPSITLPSGTKLDGKTKTLEPAQALKEVQVLEQQAKKAKIEADAAGLEAAQAKTQANSAKAEAAQAKADAKAAQAKALALEAKLAALEAKAGDDLKALREEMAETLRQAKAHAATKAAQAEDAAKDFAAQQAADALVKAKAHTDAKVGELSKTNDALAKKLKAAQQDLSKVLPPQEVWWNCYYGSYTTYRGWRYRHVLTQSGACKYERVGPVE